MSKLIPRLEAAERIGIRQQSLCLQKYHGLKISSTKVNRKVFYRDDDVEKVIKSRFSWTGGNEKPKPRHVDPNYNIFGSGGRILVTCGAHVVADCPTVDTAKQYVLEQKGKVAPKPLVFVGELV